MAYANWGTDRLLSPGRDGDLLVVPDGAHLGGDCVRCCAPAYVPLKSRRIWWYPQWIVATILVGWIITLILILVLRKKVDITYGLCPEHRRLRHRRIAIAWACGLACLPALIGGIVLGTESRNSTWEVAFPLTGFVLFLGFLIAAVLFGQSAVALRPKRIVVVGTAGTVAVLKGAGTAFLDRFPGVSAPR